MLKEQMLKIVRKLRRSRVYARLESFTAFFEERVMPRALAEEIKKRFTRMKKSLCKIISMIRRAGGSAGDRMFFYRLARKFLPAFAKALYIL